MTGAEISDESLSEKGTSIEPQTFSLTFENFVDLQTRLVLLPYDDSECTGAVIHSYSLGISAKMDHKDDVVSYGRNSNNGSISEVNEGQPVNTKDDGKVENVDKSSDTDTADRSDEKGNGNAISTAQGENENHDLANGGSGSGKITDGKETGSKGNSHVTNNNGVAQEHCKPKFEDIDDNMNKSETSPDSKDASTKATDSDENRIDCTLMKNDSNAFPLEENDSASSSVKEKNAPVESTCDVPISVQNSASNNRTVVQDSEGAYKESTPTFGTPNDTETCTNGEVDRESDDSRYRYSETSISCHVENSILSEIPGSDVAGDELMEQDFTSILNTIRTAPTPIVLTFSRAQPEEDSSIESSIESDTEETQLNSDTAAVIKGRLQRWGHQFAGEAATLSRKATDLAKEKVNEIQQTQRENETKEVAKKQHVDKPPINQRMEEQVKEKDKGKGLEICGLFLQTSSGKCIPLKEDSYGPRKRQNEDDKSSGPNDKRRRNLFRKNPPKITNTSVLVIRTSSTQACPSQGYTYQWYRSKVPGNNDASQSLNDNIWFNIDGAKRVFFQPSVTDVGFRVKCIINIENPPKKYLTDMEALPLVVICESPCEVESDKVLFDAALKTFQPMNGDDSHICVSSFDKFVGTDELENTTVRLDLHTHRDSKKEGHRCFFMKAFRAVGEPLYKGDERISDVAVACDTDRANSFYFKYYSSNNGIERILRLKAPSRIARESFLLAFGIASFNGLHSDLNCQSVLFPTADILETDTLGNIDEASDDLIHKETDEHDCNESGSITPPLNPTHSDTSVDTPVNRKMIAIEYELEKDVNILQERLGSENKDGINLQQDLVKTLNDLKAQKEESIETKKLLRIAQRRIESLESDLSRSKDDQAKHSAAYEKRKQEHNVSVSEYKRAIKSLDNEKSVLSAAVEARDSKLTKMEKLKKEIQSLKRQVEDSRNLKNQMDDLSSKNSGLQHTVMELERSNSTLVEELSGLRQGMEEVLSNVEKERRSSLAAKGEIEKLVSQMQSMKGERNRWKQKADSLAKEMSRICRGGSIADIEKLMNDHQELAKEVTLLRSQKKKAEEELEESLVTHVTYVQAQELLKTDRSAIRAVQKCTELERLVSHMTEYITAKETQLESIQAINRALTDELHLVHQNNLQHNDV